MPTTHRRVADTLRVRAAAAVLAALSLVSAGAPTLAVSANGPVASSATSWGSSVVAQALARPPVALTVATRTRLRDLPDGATVAFHPATGQVRFLSAARGRPLAAAADLRATAQRLGLRGATPDLLARAWLTGAAPLFGVARAADLQTEDVTSGRGGRATVRYQQRRRGVPVIGGELLVHLDRRGNVTGASGEALPEADAGTVARAPRLAVAEARAVAADWVTREADLPADSRAGARAVTANEGLAILDPRLLDAGGPPIPRLVWRIDARIAATVPGSPRLPTADGAPIHRLVLVDALTGDVLDTLDRVAAAYDRTVCDFHNQRLKDFRCLPGKVSRGEGDPPAGIAQVDQMYQLMARVQDFWLTRFGRDGLDGRGEGLVATVRYCLPSWCPMQNAFWEWGPQQAAFGDGWANVDDLVGHEFTHGVEDHAARLFYDYQSGAMNESFADIFGEGFDQLTTWGDDRASLRWLIGEDLRGGAVRDMQDPTRFGDADRVHSSRWWSTSNDSGGVHSNSGVGNKAAVLIAAGGTFNGYRISGIGLVKMLRIEYEAMTTRLTSASDYLDLHDALQASCLDLVGAAGITLGDCRAVRDATDATQMALLPLAGAPRRSAVCAGGHYPVTAFADDLEHPGDGLWASAAVHGSVDPWHYPQNPNGDPRWDGTWASSGDTNLFGDDVGQVTDAAIALTAPVTVPTGGLLRFEHGYRFDASSRAWDGGVVEASVDGGPWRDLGSRLINGPYTGRIAGGRGNPLHGRRAFTAVSHGWGASRVDLSDWAGHQLRIRFRIASDRKTGSYGWYIDDVRIYRCVRDPAPPTGSVVIGDGGPIVRAKSQTLTIVGTDAETAVTRMRVSNDGILRAGLLRDGVEMPFATTLDWLLTDTAWGGTAGDGAKRVWMQLADRAGNWSQPFNDRVVLDTTPPTVGAPVPRFVTGTTVATSEPLIPVRVGFSADDATTGLAQTSLERKRDAGDWTTVDLGDATATGASVHLPDDPAVAWRFRARAQDVAGAWSDLVASGPFSVVSAQEASGRWTWTGDWATRAAADAFGGSIRTADVTDASGAILVNGAAVALVAPVGPGMGIAALLLDGTQVATVDLHAASPDARRLVWTSALPSGDHTLSVVATGTSDPDASGTRVAIDAIIELR